MRENWKTGLASMAIALAVLGLTGVARPARNARRAVNPPGTPTGLPFSNGIVVGDTLYVAGQEGLEGGKPVPGGIEAETRAALEAIRKIVTAAGFEMSDVATVNVYLADLDDFGKMNNVYKTFFPEPRPARATVQVARLVNDARVEISAVAVKGP